MEKGKQYEPIFRVDEDEERLNLEEKYDRRRAINSTAEHRHVRCSKVLARGLWDGCGRGGTHLENVRSYQQKLGKLQITIH